MTMAAWSPSSSFMACSRRLELRIGYRGFALDLYANVGKALAGVESIRSHVHGRFRTPAIHRCSQTGAQIGGGGCLDSFRPGRRRTVRACVREIRVAPELGRTLAPAHEPLDGSPEGVRICISYRIRGYRTGNTIWSLCVMHFSAFLRHRWTSWFGEAKGAGHPRTNRSTQIAWILFWILLGALFALSSLDAFWIRSSQSR
jgi:hypothetical protein